MYFLVAPYSVRCYSTFRTLCPSVIRPFLERFGENNFFKRDFEQNKSATDAFGNNTSGHGNYRRWKPVLKSPGQ